MTDFVLSSHARDMLVELNIHEEWGWLTLNTPDHKRIGEDNNDHYTKVIEEHGGRILYVVVNSSLRPNRIVTVFFDRRLRKIER